MKWNQINYIKYNSHNGTCSGAQWGLSADRDQTSWHEEMTWVWLSGNAMRDSRENCHCMCTEWISLSGRDHQQKHTNRPFETCNPIPIILFLRQTFSLIHIFLSKYNHFILVNISAVFPRFCNLFFLCPQNLRSSFVSLELELSHSVHLV